MSGLKWNMILLENLSGLVKETQQEYQRNQKQKTPGIQSKARSIPSITIPKSHKPNWRNQNHQLKQTRHKYGTNIEAVRREDIAQCRSGTRRLISRGIVCRR